MQLLKIEVVWKGHCKFLSFITANKIEPEVCALDELVGISLDTGLAIVWVLATFYFMCSYSVFDIPNFFMIIL